MDKLINLFYSILHVNDVVDTYYFLDDRLQKLTEDGYTITERRMGTGGVGQIKSIGNEIRIQVSHQLSYGYSKVVVIPFKWEMNIPIWEWYEETEESIQKLNKNFNETSGNNTLLRELH